MDKRSIEYESRVLLRRVVEDRSDLFPLGRPSPLQLIDPETVARFLQLDLQYAESLGTWKRGDANYKIAGLLDQQRRLIRVSTDFPYPTQRFTAAHEVAHVWLKHPGRVIHRDRPVFELKPDCVRDPVEQEADYFAACLLAPRELVTTEYKARFGIGPPLPLNDAVAWNLCGDSAYQLRQGGTDSLRFGVAVASAERFNGRPFTSLAQHFSLSVSAMAIRLRELNLIDH